MMSSCNPFGMGFSVGEYGRRSATWFQQLAEQAPELAMRTPVSYTSSRNPSLFDAFGYAAVDIETFDCNGNGTLEGDEVVQAFGGDADLGCKYLKVLDRNCDGALDTSEMAAFMLFQDAAPTLLREPEAPSCGCGGNMETQRGADGVITPQESWAADEAVLNNPELAGEILDQIHAELNLDKVGQMFDMANQAAKIYRALAEMFQGMGNSRTNCAMGF